MNSRDFAREMRRARRERVNRPPDPRNVRRVDLIRKMEIQQGHLSQEDKAELVQLQRRFGLPDQLD